MERYGKRKKREQTTWTVEHYREADRRVERFRPKKKTLSPMHPVITAEALSCPEWWRPTKRRRIPASQSIIALTILKRWTNLMKGQRRPLFPVTNQDLYVLFYDLWAKSKIMMQRFPDEDSAKMSRGLLDLARCNIIGRIENDKSPMYYYIPDRGDAVLHARMTQKKISFENNPITVPLWVRYHLGTLLVDRRSPDADADADASEELDHILPGLAFV